MEEINDNQHNLPTKSNNTYIGEFKFGSAKYKIIDLRDRNG